MKILVDGYGSDKGPKEILAGCLIALERHPGLSIGLLGPAELKEASHSDRLKIVETDSWIQNDEEPVRAVRQKKEASIVLGCRLMEDGEYEGVLSAGSTGAMLAAGLLVSKRIPGIQRAALTVLLPTQPQPTVMLDAGANMDCNAELLMQFAVMGQVYAKNVLGLTDPRVGLLNVGTEEGKGNTVVKEAYERFQNAPFRFVGNMEARDLLNGVCDVIVADGFSGNIALKTMEGVAGFISGLLKRELMRSTRTKIGALMAKPALNALKSRMDYKTTGAAPLLGIRKPIFKAHGSSDREAIANGIDKLVLFVEHDTIAQMTKILSENLGLGADHGA